METEHFGSLLRQARERRQMSLTEIAEKTKVSVSSLQFLEEGKLGDLPPEVFVRGFIRSYARTVGLPEGQPLGLFDQEIAARKRDEEGQASTPAGLEASAAAASEEGGGHPRRGIGVAVFVIIVLLLATITLSLFLRQPPPSGEGLSFHDAAPAPTGGTPRTG